MGTVIRFPEPPRRWRQEQAERAEDRIRRPSSFYRWSASSVSPTSRQRPARAAASAAAGVAAHPNLSKPIDQHYSCARVRDSHEPHAGGDRACDALALVWRGSARWLRRSTAISAASRPSLVTDDMHDGSGARRSQASALPPRNFRLTDDERQLRDLAYALIAPPYDRMRWDSMLREYGLGRARTPPQKLLRFDRAAYWRSC